jgi:hypothetical protein
MPPFRLPTGPLSYTLPCPATEDPADKGATFVAAPSEQSPALVCSSGVTSMVDDMEEASGSRSPWEDWEKVGEVASSVDGWFCDCTKEGVVVGRVVGGREGDEEVERNEDDEEEA